MVLTGKMRAGRPRSRGLVGTCGRVAWERGPLARILDAGTVLTGSAGGPPAVPERHAWERGPLARILGAGTVLMGKMRAGRPPS